jgi:hypothetical protein
LTHRTRSAALLTTAVAVVAGTLTACSSSSGSAAKPAGTGSASVSAVAKHAASSAAEAGSKTDPTKVDVCGLLDQGTASTVATSAKLADDNPGTTPYRLMKTKVSITGGSACRFVIIAPNDGEVEFLIQVQSARYYLPSPDDKKIPALGDDAYLEGTPVVRVGDLKMSVGDDGLPEVVLLALMRNMAPLLRMS